MLRCISDVLFMEVFLHLPSVIFSFVHKISYIGTHLSLVDGAFLAYHICF